MLRLSSDRSDQWNGGTDRTAVTDRMAVTNGLNKNHMRSNRLLH